MKTTKFILASVLFVQFCDNAIGTYLLIVNFGIEIKYYIIFNARRCDAISSWSSISVQWRSAGDDMHYTWNIVGVELLSGP
jgi:hypothetical protein